MVYLYPKTISTTTGHSTKYGTQNISNKTNLCSNSTALAFWGVKNPKYLGKPLRNYPDSITTPHGSYYKPETIYASGWTIDNIPDNAIIKKFYIEYKWEQISYSSKTAYGEFKQPVISVIYKGKEIYTFQGARPEKNRYNNNTTNTNKMNTNYAELTTLHSHPIDVSNYNLTIKDLKNIQIKFNPAKNTADNHCRIIMQFIRLNIQYKEKEEEIVVPRIEKLPTFQIIKSEITPYDTATGLMWTYTCTVKSTNSIIKETNCTLDFSDLNTYIHNITTDDGNTYDQTKGLWQIKKFYNKTATLQLQCSSQTLGTKKITAQINKYADSINYKKTASIEIVPDRIALDIQVSGDQKPYVYRTKGEEITKCINFYLTSDRIHQDAVLTIDTNGWLRDGDIHIDEGTASMTYLADGKWGIQNISTNKLQINTYRISNNIKKCPILRPGTYTIKASYKAPNQREISKEIEINVIGNTLNKDYFKLRLEDGSDVRYNSLMFTEGDDLRIPLTYDIKKTTDLKDNIFVTGEVKTIPVGEARYITFDVELKNTKETYYNILTYIDVINADTTENSSDVIIGSDSNIELFQAGEHKYCVIDELKPNEPKKIKFIVQSDNEQKCNIKIKPFNYDCYTDKWKMGEVYFKDIPNLKLSIQTDKYDLNTNNNANLSVTYTIENKSLNSYHVYSNDISGYKFKIKEPSSFKVKKITINDDDVDYVLSPPESDSDATAPWFNTNNRILTLPYIQGATYNAETGNVTGFKYTLRIDYEATQKGIYNFSLCTEDNPLFLEDDQYKNCTSKQVLVDIDSNINVKTYVTKSRPYLNEVFDFTIKIKNYNKKQDKIIFDIYDTGSYDDAHSKNHYDIEYINYEKSSFTVSDKNNKIGTWIINDVDINDEYMLTLTLRPKEIGYHNIKTILTHNEESIQRFDNVVNVLERNKLLSFNVYHAIDTTDENDCSNCNALTEICDEDYILLDDEIYYVFEVTNNSRTDIKTATHVYARLPKSFEILCHTQNYSYKYDEESGLISFTIPELGECETKKICLKTLPKEKGTYITNFMLTNKNAHTYHKTLKLYVDNNLNQRKIEHEIAIYNFEKTNRYFRYELDGDSNIFKFFNQGNRPTRYVDAEQYGQSAIEYYKGSNLKELVKKIANESKYVEPELLRIGSNKLSDKGYEIYPDSFMRRFGLLNSEVYHYAHQLPTTTNTVDYAMRWDIDDWNSKVWGGGIYENGVFDLSVDYGKVPTNFNILEIDDPIGKLQALVDKVKPFGTKALCYYADTIDLKMNININPYESLVNNIIDYNLLLSKLGLVSIYDRHDNTLFAYHDLLEYNMKNDIELINNIEYNDYDPMSLSFANTESDINTDISLYADIFDSIATKKYIDDCLDIIDNAYVYNNVDILKKYTYEGSEYNNQLIEGQTNSKYTFEYQNISDKNIKINIDDNIYIIKYVENAINNFNGFVITENEKDIFKKNLGVKVSQCFLQIEIVKEDTEKQQDTNAIHFWVSIDKKYYYHIGFLVVDLFDYKNGQATQVTINAIDADTYEKEHYTAPTRRSVSNDFIHKEEIYFAINNDIHNILIEPDLLLQDGKKWEKTKNFFNKNEYTFVENKAEIDPHCHDSYISVPQLAIKYNNININDYDEIYDIKIKMDAASNKANFIDDVKIQLLKDADYYIPENNIAKKTFYPNSVTNFYEEYINHISIQQPNITICSNCLKTSLGYYDKCPYCSSDLVSHYNEKHAVTICYDCNYITNGWYEYCPHCLSNDIEKTKVDFNKTYCTDCNNLENDYYTHCPKCFSENVLHLNNDEHKYNIRSDKYQNIDSIVVKNDTSRINIFNITVPFNYDTPALQEYEYLQLHIHGINNNDGKFYYCEQCQSAGLGNYNVCPSCEHQNIINYEFNNVTMDIYVQTGNKYYRIDTDTEYDQLKGEFDIAIDLKDLAQKNTGSEFKLLFYVENLLYDKINYTINKFNTNERDYTTLTNNIPVMDIVIDNIYYYSKYIKNEWKGLDQLEGTDHTGVIYNTQNETETDYISFNDFHIDNEKYESLILNVNGLNKSHSNVKIHLMIFDIDENVLYSNDISQTDNFDGISTDLFNYTIDVTKYIDSKKLPLVSNIKISFSNITEQTDIIITDCYFVGSFHKDTKDIDNSIDNANYNIIQQNSEYLLSSNNIFGLKNTMPYYLDGKQLKNNIVCLLDFGDINADEYIRLYNVELMIAYKNKFGKIMTENVMISDETYDKHLINANIEKNQADVWSTIQTPMNILNNLEYQIINNDDEDSLSAIPLTSTLAQSFMLTYNNISTVSLNYFGQIGTPSNRITIELYDDYQNEPDNLIYSKNVILPSVSGIVEINFDIDNLNINEQYWIVLKDDSADQYNYHRFRYNDSLGVGNLIFIRNNNYQRDQNRALCLSIDSKINAYEFYNLPMVINDDNLTFKFTQQLYRYNINSLSNAYISNIKLQSGYRKYNENEEPNVDINDDEEIEETIEVTYGE